MSAVVVNWNGGETVVDTVRSLLQHRPAVPFEVIVVDNGSTDGSPDLIASTFGGDVRVQRNERNLGLAAANNQGIALAGHDLLLVCNPDVLLDPGSVGALMACLARHPRAAWAVPRLRRPDGSMQTAVGDLPGLGDALLGRRWAAKRSGERRGFWWDGFAHDEEVAVGHAMECCYLVRREVIEAVGAQDERYRLDWEGIDWAARTGAAGWEIWFCPDAEVVHLGGVSVSQVPLRWVIGSHRGMYRYFADRSPILARPLLALAFSARGSAKAAAVLTGAWSYRRSFREGRAADRPS